MRLSARPEDPDYDERLVRRPGTTVRLDGRPVARVVCADEDKGTVEIFATGADGRMIRDGDEFATVTLKGRVEIDIPEKDRLRINLQRAARA